MSKLRFAALFSVLVLVTGLIFLQWSNNTLKLRLFFDLSPPASPFSLSALYYNSTGALTGSPSPRYRHSYCHYWVHNVSPEEAQEERALLDLIRWPGPPPQLTGSFHLSWSSDPAHSHFSILPAEGDSQRHVGDQLEARIQMFDFQGHPKTYGGDFLFARLHSPKLSAAVAGQVVDHLNGTYSAFFPLLWEGSAQVEVVLVHPSEAVALLGRLLRERPDRVLFKSDFRSGGKQESTYCNICLAPSKLPICNYTDPYTGEPWYCYKPQHLGCDTRVTHMRAGSEKDIASKQESLLFKKDSNLKVKIPPSNSEEVTVLPKRKHLEAVIPGRTGPGPSGYYFKDAWKNLAGISIRQFNDAPSISQCLRDKQLHMFGDSTVRQWYEYFKDNVKDLKQIDLHVPKQVGPYLAVDSIRHTMVTYRCHGPPLSYTVLPVSDLHYIATEVDHLPGGPNMVVVIGILAHMAPFPAEVYIHRLRNIRAAVVRLHQRAPQTKVVIRTGNPRSLTREELDHSLNFSDWFSLLRLKVLRAMFQKVNVHLVDAWEMTQVHRLPHDIHPAKIVVKNMIDVLLSHIC